MIQLIQTMCMPDRVLEKGTIMRLGDMKEAAWVRAGFAVYTVAELEEDIMTPEQTATLERFLKMLSGKEADVGTDALFYSQENDG